MPPLFDEALYLMHVKGYLNVVNKFKGNWRETFTFKL